MSFYEYIKIHAEKDSSHPAIIENNTCLSYGEFISQVERFASAFSNLKLNPNSKIGLLCLNQKEYLIAFLAALLKGVPVIPFNFMLNPEELIYITQDAGVDTLVVDSAFVKPEFAPFFKLFNNKILAGLADHKKLGKDTLRWKEFMVMGNSKESVKRHERAENIPDVILYTSGTTAKPKGVMLEESQFDANCTGFLQYLNFTGDDRVIVALPLFHSFGNIMALALLRSGATLILLQQFQPKTILESIEQHKATILPLVPTIYSFLAQLYARGGYDVSSLRYCISGGASLPEPLLERVEEGLGVTVIEGYGLTETSPVIAVNTMKEGSFAGSVGPVLPNIELDIFDNSGKPVAQGEIGEIRVRGETVMKGYWKKPNETEKAFSTDGWLKTGDLGHIDQKGRLFISAGRIKDLIIRAGENVSPLAIENALMNHPAIIEVAAVGIPNERVGEKVKVFAVIREGTKVTAQELKELCRKKLSNFMIPDTFQFMKTLPKTATGKILKCKLRQSTAKEK
jgi:long-chain acyl-CoA synthetase